MTPSPFIVEWIERIAGGVAGIRAHSTDHLLEPGELRGGFDGFDELFYEEVPAPDAVARLVARSRS